jgi:predicted metal-dependent enzyme (double-stranded beta helix superfamily)
MREEVHAMATISFDLDSFLDECRAATAEANPPGALRELLTRTMEHPGSVGDALRPERGGITLLHHAPDLTVIHVVWAPGMTLFPHDHRMWAAIGIYSGQEDNAFFRRTAPAARTLVESGGKELAEGDVLVLGDHTIHSVSNPLRRLTAAIHVYGGDFVNQPRSQWGPGPREERPFDMDDANRQFEDANRAWEATSSR